MPPIATKPPDEQQTPAPQDAPTLNSGTPSPNAAGGSDEQRATPDGLIPAAYGSPTPSEFGEGFKQGSGTAAPLPKHIVDFLETQDLEAFYVPGDGNCFYRAATFGPRFSKHDVLRLAVAAHLGSAKMPGNVIGSLLDWNQIQKVSESMHPYKCFLISDGEWRDPDVGEPLRKAGAEVLRSNIQVWDSKRLDSPQLYSFEPQFLDDNEMPQVQPRKTEPIRLLLYREHYYPLFRKGSFPDNRLEHSAAKEQNLRSPQFKESPGAENRVLIPIESPVRVEKPNDPGNSPWQMITGEQWPPYQDGQISHNINSCPGIYLAGVLSCGSL